MVRCIALLACAATVAPSLAFLPPAAPAQRTSRVVMEAKKGDVAQAVFKKAASLFAPLAVMPFFTGASFASEYYQDTTSLQVDVGAGVGMETGSKASKPLSYDGPGGDSNKFPTEPTGRTRDFMPGAKSQMTGEGVPQFADARREFERRSDEAESRRADQKQEAQGTQAPFPGQKQVEKLVQGSQDAFKKTGDTAQGR